MVLTTGEILFNDVPTKSYKDLLDFLDRNLDSIINRGQIKFRFTIVKTADLENLRKRGINKFPAMTVIGSKAPPCIGTPNIIDELRARTKNSKKVATPMSEEEVLEAYQKNEMHTEKDHDGKLIVPSDQEKTDNGIDLVGMLNKELERRGQEMKQYKGYREEDPPRKPSRQDEVIRDTDYEDRGPKPPKQRPRQDNILQDPGDPRAILHRMKPGDGKGAQKDDEMMQQLLDRMGDSDF